MNIIRKKRVWYPGAEYHIMNRGNRKGDIFLEDDDYQMYLKLLKVAGRKFPFHLIGYCLMTNHVHLQIKTIEDEHWRIIQYVHSIYSMYFNKKYNLVGHLFQGRYTDEIIEDDVYKLKVSRYIHLNPVRAKMVIAPAEYPWSSYRDYIGEASQTIIDLEKQQIMDYFTGDKVARYRRFVEKGMGSDPRQL